jgi:hypothetical protein
MKLKNKIVLILYGTFFLTGTLAAVPESAYASPSAFLPEPIHTFKPVIEGTEVVHDFTLRNAGNETLYIENLKSG